MLSKLIFCVFLAGCLTCGSRGAEYNQQISSISPQFLDMSSFDTKSIVGQPTTINHKSFIEHASSGTGSSSGNGGSSLHHTTGTRSSTLLNKAIAEQGAVSDPVTLPSSYTNVQTSPPSFSSDSVGIFSNNYANSGIFSPGLFGTSFDNAVGPVPSVLSLNSRIDHTAPGSISSVTNGISSLNNNKDRILSSGFLSDLFDKRNIPVPEIISVSVSSSTDDHTSASIPSSFRKVPTVNYANDGILPTGQLGTSLSKDAISTPNAVSIYSANHKGAARKAVASPTKISSSVGPAESSFLSTVNYANDGVISTVQPVTSLGKDVVSIPNSESIYSVNGDGATGRVAAVSVPVKVPSSVGPAESSFLSSFGAVAEKPSAFSTPDSISLRKIASAQNEAPSVDYSAEKVVAAPVVAQPSISNPTMLTSQASIDKYLSTPASDLLGLLGSGYNTNHNGIISSGLLGSPVSSIFGLTGKELSTNGLSSFSNIGNNGNVGGGLANIPVVANKDNSLNKFQTVIQHAAPANAAAAPMAFSGINNNNIFNGLTGNGIFADPLGFPNGLFGSIYNGMNGYGAGNFAVDDVFSKYLWR